MTPPGVNSNGWCQWFRHTGRKVKHKRTGVVAEVVWVTKNGDVEVQLESGNIVTWFKENIREVRP